MPQPLVQRAKRRAERNRAVRRGVRFTRNVRLAITPAVWTDGRRTALPLRYRWLRIGSVGQTGDPAQQVVVHDLLASPSAPPAPRLDAVLIPATPDHLELSPSTVTALIAAESLGVPTVLLARQVSDLDHPLAAVCCDVVSDDPDVIAAATSRVGPESVHSLPSLPRDATKRELSAWVRTLVREVLYEKI